MLARLKRCIGAKDIIVVSSLEKRRISLRLKEMQI